MSKILFFSLMLSTIASSAIATNNHTVPSLNITEPIYTYEIDGKKVTSNVKNLKIQTKGVWQTMDFGDAEPGEKKWITWDWENSKWDWYFKFLPGEYSGSMDFRVDDNCAFIGSTYPVPCYITFSFIPRSYGVKRGSYLQQYYHVPYSDYTHLWYDYLWTMKGGSETPPVPAPDVKKPQCEQKKKGSIIRADSLSFGEEIPIIGTDFSLVYSSEYAAEYITSYVNKGSRNDSFTPEGWSISNHHFYDAANERIFYGSGVSYPKPFGTYDGKRMVVNGSEVYLFDSTGKHLKTLSYLTGYTKYEFAYNSLGRLISITDAFANVTNFNRSGSTVDIVSPFGQTSQIVMDSRARVSQVVIPSGDSYKMSYKGDSDLLATFETPAGRKTNVTYGAKGRLLSNRTGGSGWDFVTSGKIGSSNVVAMSQISTMNREWTNEQYNYGANRYYKVQTDPSGLKTMYYEEPDGSSTTVTPIGTTTAFKAEDPRFGNLLSYTNGRWLIGGGKQKGWGLTKWVEGATLNPFVYDGIGMSINVDGRIENSFFDKQSSELSIVSEGGVLRKIKFNNAEQVIQSQLNNDTPITYEYDSNGKLVRVNQGVGRQTQIFYDLGGNIGKVVDPVGRETAFEYNLNRDLTKVIDPSLRSIGFVVDKDGNRTQVIAPNNLTHTLNRNVWGYVQSYTPPFLNDASGKVEYTYNSEKAITRIVKKGSQPLNFTYGLDGQLIAVESGETKQVYGYDIKNGLLASVKSFDGITSNIKYTLDVVSQMTNLDSVGNILSKMRFNFDSSLFPTQKAFDSDYFPVSHKITLSYDLDHRPIQVGELAIAYEPGSGRLKNTVLQSTEDQYSYDTFGRLSSYTVGFRSPDNVLKPLYSYTLVRDLVGRIIEKTETVLESSTNYNYLYDNSSRLILVKKNGTITGEFSYDLNGNIVSKRTGSSTMIGVYDSQDRLISMGQSQYQYKASGELRTIQRSLFPDLNLSYSPLGYLKKYTVGKGKSIEYILDADGSRVKKLHNGKIVSADVFENSYRLAGQFDFEHSMFKKYVHATRINTPDYMILGHQTYRIVSDHLGSPRLIVNTSTGQIKQKMDYDVWGKFIEDTNAGFQPFGFAGGLYDQESKLLRFGARDYDPDVGRWTSKDPILFDGGDTNLYGYVANDPVNWVDPSGLIRDPSAIFNEALNHPNSSSGTNGPGNAFQHCFASCMMAGENGSATAAALGAGFEFINNLQGQKDDAYCMDMHNNQVGRDLARENGISNLTSISEASHKGVSSACAQACIGANSSGRLVNLEGR